MRELLGALGLAWPRLLIYPSGVVGLGLAWLLGRWIDWVTDDRRRTKAGVRPIFVLRPSSFVYYLDCLPPLLGLALLPLPPARSFPYGIDLLAALTLFEWPRWRARMGGCECRAPSAERQEPRTEDLPGDLYIGYGLILVSVLAINAATGGIELAGLLHTPASVDGRILLLSGGLLWLFAQRYLGARARAAGMAERLATLGHLLISVLPLLALLATALEERLPAGWSGWLLPALAFCAAALVLGAALRLEQPARWAERLTIAMAGALIIWLIVRESGLLR